MGNHRIFLHCFVTFGNFYLLDFGLSRFGWHLTSSASATDVRLLVHTVFDFNPLPSFSRSLLHAMISGDLIYEERIKSAI